MTLPPIRLSRRRHPSIEAPTATDLDVLLTIARARTVGLTADLNDEQLRVPRLDILNPPLWEIGHVAWFHEKWNLRHQAGRRPLRADADALFDSAAIAHDTRWDLPLPPREEVFRYLDHVHLDVRERLVAASSAPSDADLYFAQLSLMHEEMHAEAFAYTRQTLELPPPEDAMKVLKGTYRNSWNIEGRHHVAAGSKPASLLRSGPCPGDVDVSGGTFLLGASPTKTFLFDNEKWAHPVRVAPFSIARAATTNAEFAEFVDAGGYDRREHWSDAGWKWRSTSNDGKPAYSAPMRESMKSTCWPLVSAAGLATARRTRL